jgi:phenylalanyl-tRNA synthetase beta chain
VKFLLSWIREFAPADLPLAELSRRLTSAGMPVETVTELAGGDAVLDIEVFTNRPDAMNVYGMAREVAAACDVALAPYPRSVEEAGGEPAAGTLARVSIEEPSLCGRYTSRIVRGMKVGPSPDWLARRLTDLGMRPINNVVDVTNYVLWEYGHPLHAFDMGLLQGRPTPSIHVRRARPGERLVTLDGVGRELDNSMLVIADADRAVALAGVMGGASTMVSERTTDVLLECAWFDPVTVRRMAKKLGMSTDASYRFERGADIEATPVALARVADLLRQIAGGRVLPGLIDERPMAPATRRVRVRPARTAVLLGMPLPPADVAMALKALGFTVDAGRGDALEVEVPSYRQDIEREVDLIEEVGRHIGYDAIPGRLPTIAGTGGIDRVGDDRERRMRRALAGAGYAQAVTVSIVSQAADWGLREPAGPNGPANEPVTLANPLAADQEILRTTLLPTLLESVARNVNRGVRDVRLYEIGRTFRRAPAPPPGHADRKHPLAGGVDEILRLGMALTGAARQRHWSEPAREASFFDLKGALEAALCEGGSPALTFEPMEPTDCFEPGRAAWVHAGAARIGRIGTLAAAWRERLDLRQDVQIAEVDLTRLYRLAGEAITYTPLPRFPAVTRDLSLVVPAGVAYRRIESAIQQAAPALVSDVQVVDRYTGTELPPGTAGLTLRVTLQHPERTLGSEEVQQAQDQIVGTLSNEFAISLRR